MALTMPDIHVALITVRYDEANLEMLRASLAPAEVIVVDHDDDRGIRRALERADVAVLASDLDDRFVSAPRLAWAHCDHAGIERSARAEVFERGLIVSGSAGRSAPALAEHAVFFMLALNYDAPGLLRAQMRRRWGAPAYRARRPLVGRTLGIVGLGHTGTALALLAKALGMRVLGWRRREASPPPGVDRVFSAEAGDRVDVLLAESDFVVLAASLSDATRHLIDAAALGRMKSGAYLINVARGGLVDEVALARALTNGQIAGAGLDTFEVEPLPRSRPLWNCPNTIITPHQTPKLRDRTERSLAIIGENIRRYRNGKRLLNQLMPEDVYTPPLARPASLRKRLLRRLRRLLHRADASHREVRRRLAADSR